MLGVQGFKFLGMTERIFSRGLQGEIRHAPMFGLTLFCVQDCE